MKKIYCFFMALLAVTLNINIASAQAFVTQDLVVLAGPFDRATFENLTLSGTQLGSFQVTCGDLEVGTRMQLNSDPWTYSTAGWYVGQNETLDIRGFNDRYLSFGIFSTANEGESILAKNENGAGDGKNAFIFCLGGGVGEVSANVGGVTYTTHGQEKIFFLFGRPDMKTFMSDESVVERTLIGLHSDVAGAMYSGSFWNIEQVPEPTSGSIVAVALMSLIVRRGMKK